MGVDGATPRASVVFSSLSTSCEADDLLDWASLASLRGDVRRVAEDEHSCCG